MTILFILDFSYPGGARRFREREPAPSRVAFRVASRIPKWQDCSPIRGLFVASQSKAGESR